MGYSHQESSSITGRLPARAVPFAPAAGMLVQYALLFVLAEAFLMPPVSASILGFLAGATTHYLLCRNQLTQRSVNESKFVAMAWMGVMLNAAVMCVLAMMAGVHYLPAQIAATSVVLLWDSFVNRFWRFADELPAPAP